MKGVTAKSSEKGAKKRMTGEERKAQIVRVATDLFAKKGFKGTTTREIAVKAGISEAVIFKHFARKEDLYTAIIDSRCSDNLGQPRLMNLLKGKKGKVVFKEVASYLITEHQRDSSFLRLLTYSALEKHELSELFIKTKGLELFGFLESHIKELMDEGVLKKADPAISAAAFMGMVLHYSISQEIYGLKRYYKWPNEHVVASFVDIFFEGMRR
ncbi:MAG: TetR/AcrR family transcriptional regulator [Deltaproteobacteria bacterium]|nr:TetR/AcrR family transcriptional regulator [Deltaproteobacteria bacterium]